MINLPSCSGRGPATPWLWEHSGVPALAWARAIGADSRPWTWLGFWVLGEGQAATI
jgi:hypothetical protein